MINNKAFAIKAVSPYGVSWVVTKNIGKGLTVVNTYAGLGALPSLFLNKSEALTVVKIYKEISKNSGKTPHPLKIVEINLD